MVKKSDVIVEGKVVEVNCFDIKDVRRILYAKIRITKMLKSEIADSFIYLITDGGICNGAYIIASDGFVISPKDEGIFLLMKDTSTLKYSLPVQLYYPFLGQKSFIGYNQYYPVGHRAYGFTTPYDDIETELFQHIESITGQKRKVLGPNMFEIPGRFSIDTCLYYSDAVIAGRIISATTFDGHNSGLSVSAIVRIAYAFKGEIKDSLIEIIYHGYGTETDSFFARGYSLYLKKGMDGVFFLNKNIYWPSLHHDLQSFVPVHRPNAFIAIMPSQQNSSTYIGVSDSIPNNNNSQTTLYSDIEKDIFQKIETITGQKRKILGLNIFEQEALKKQRKK
jgi:hypothetical protein